MTTHKAFKRRVRARMVKTGERYAAARRNLIDQTEQPAVDGAPAAGRPEPPAAAAAATGAPPLVSDDAVRRATNRGWADWFAILDAAGAADWPHPDIARWVAAEHGISGWWAQNVTVAYERARGRRAANERPSGFTVSASRTVDVPVDRLFQAFADEAVRGRWLDQAVRVRTATAPRNIRFDWADGTRVAAGFTAKGPSKALVALEHELLPDSAAVERLRAVWRPALARLKALLEGEATEG